MSRLSERIRKHRACLEFRYEPDVYVMDLKPGFRDSGDGSDSDPVCSIFGETVTEVYKRLSDIIPFNETDERTINF